MSEGFVCLFIVLVSSPGPYHNMVVKHTTNQATSPAKKNILLMSQCYTDHWQPHLHGSAILQ